MPEKMKRIYIFDTTLRDGEQSPGASMSVEDKFRMAQQLVKLKVDTIEAGFPISSPVQFEGVRQIAKKLKGPVITGLARSLKKDIDSCYEAVKYSSRPGVHVFLATSDIHLKHKFNISRDRAIELIAEAVAYARKKLDWVQFSCEDATRTAPDFLAKAVRTAIRAGAKVINLPDTVGYAVPSEYRRMIENVRLAVPELDGVVISVHCHNDLGLAVANSLSAVEAGAQQIECAVNGIGERAGNASLEEAVMGLYVRKPWFKAVCGVNTRELFSASRLLTSITGIPVQPNKAIVGENAFSHEAGIHQDGVIKYRKTYEIMDPQSIGVPANKLILGRHSGKHGFTRRIEELGIRMSEKETDACFAKFLELADKKRQVYDDDLLALISDVKNIEISKNSWQIAYFHVMSGTGVIPNATVKLVRGREERVESANGDGPVDAVYKAISRITGLAVKLVDYRINSITSGEEALGEVSVDVEYGKEKFSAHGTSTDIIEASAKAFIAALNRIGFRDAVSGIKRKKP